jgi:PIN domain nuclease of toxin-antitoxin system
MRFLLDTHTIIWFIEGDLTLSFYANDLIKDSKNEIAVSTVSLFEMAIKIKLGKLNIDGGLAEFIKKIKAQRIDILSIKETHLNYYQNISLLDTHKDPFDRLLIATAASENIPIITIDKQFINYSNLVQIIW